MMTTLKKKMAALIHGQMPADEVVRSFGRHRTQDVAITYRMGAGYPGDVNRTHPATIEPVLFDLDAPPTTFGNAVLVDPTTQGVRPIVAGDVALTAVYGVLVRPFPTQQITGGMTAAFGSGGPGVATSGDVLKSGYIMVKVNGATVKGQAAHIWAVASAGAHVQGGWEAAATAASTIDLAGANFYYNGVPDANGYVELAFNV